MSGSLVSFQNGITYSTLRSMGNAGNVTHKENIGMIFKESEPFTVVV